MDTTPDTKRKYKHMENVLQYVISNHISLDEGECRRNNVILNKILEILTSKLKGKSEFFKLLFRRTFYGGSYYDGLRVGKPEEYDLDFLLCLPKITRPQLTVGSLDGYLKVQLTEFEQILTQKDTFAKYYMDFKALLDEENFLIADKVFSWMQGVTTSILNEFPVNEKNENDERIIKVNDVEYYLKVHKSGPAVTLKLWGQEEDRVVKIDIDLVPCLVFGKEALPLQLDESRDKLFGKEGTPMGEFFIVPKPVKGQSQTDKNKPYREWRLSFQEQERQLISKCNTLKPSLKLLKKLRDHQNHKAIASYFLKTIYLWEAPNFPAGFWSNPLGLVFLEMLKKYQQCLAQGRIPYYWNENNNLIENLSKNAQHLCQVKKSIDKIVNDIEQNYTDPYVMIKYLLPSADCEKVKQAVPTKPLSDGQVRALSRTDSQNSSVPSVEVPPQREASTNSDAKLDQILACLNTLTNKVNNIQNENKCLRDDLTLLMGKMKLLESDRTEE